MSGSERSAEVNSEVNEQTRDVAFADPQGQKYPLDTEEHIRAAWNFISDTADVAAYDGDERESIKDRIRHAARQKAIDLEGASPARQAPKEQGDNPLDPHRKIDSAMHSESMDK